MVVYGFRLLFLSSQGANPSPSSACWRSRDQAKSAAQLSLVVPRLARLHGNDAIPIDSLELGVSSIARCPLPSFHRWTMFAALPPLSRYGSGVLPSFCGSIHPGSLPSPTAVSVPRTYMCCVQKHALTWAGGCASLPACRGEDATVPQLPLFRVGPICRAYQPASSEKGTRGEREAHAH